MKLEVSGMKISRYPAPPLFTASVGGIACSLPNASPSDAIANGHELRGILLEQEIVDGND